MYLRLPFILIFLSFIFYLSSCRRSTEPVYNRQNLKLQVVDVSCAEAWLSLKAKNDYLNKTLKLFQNDSLVLEKNLTTDDSLLYVDGLWPNTSYRFKARVYEGSKLQAQSTAVTATTMDTTSHDFTWQTFEFGGQGGSSSFYDVAIIDENNPSGGASRTGIWAVGEIYTADDKYNAAHYDGQKWQRIESGKGFDFHDIISDINPYSGKRKIIAVASVFEYNKKGKQLIKSKGEIVSQIDTTGLPDALQSFWFKAGRIIT